MTGKILNLTQHPASAEQIKAGVTEPAKKKQVQSLLTFQTLPKGSEVLRAAEKIAALADGYSSVMIGGAPFLMAPLETALKKRGIEPLYAFSVRESREKTLPDGGVVKTQIFKHMGFVSGFWGK